MRAHNGTEPELIAEDHRFTVPPAEGVGVRVRPRCSLGWPNAGRVPEVRLTNLTRRKGSIHSRNMNPKARNENEAPENETDCRNPRSASIRIGVLADGIVPET